jgi:hypothetical protein
MYEYLYLNVPKTVSYLLKFISLRSSEVLQNGCPFPCLSVYVITLAVRIQEGTKY